MMKEINEQPQAVQDTIDYMVKDGQIGLDKIGISDELIKRRFHNTENGFILCSTKTMGWSPGSGCCKECNFVDKCLQVTERRYPELLRLRREEDGKGKK